MNNILPWQQKNWEQLQQQLNLQRVPHALLLHGPEGTGKGLFASIFAQRLLCTTPQEDGFSCGSCPSCKLFAAATHPDLISLKPDEGKSILAVDQVREMVREFAFTPQISARKVVILQPAESMNNSAANSLLKTLEEPPGEAVLMLISHAPARLLPTIRSRCQQRAFPSPDRTQSLQWLQQKLEQGMSEEAVLQLAEGAPLKALALANPEQIQHHQQMGEELINLLSGRADPIRVAIRWSDKKLDPSITLEWLQQWTTQIIKGDTQSPLLNSLASKLQPVDHKQLFLFYDKLTAAIALSHTPVNKELLFEGILLDWSRFR
ncbi:MAG: DNA polymerase III subunit delta' [Gammaproteobacteria bacterium]|jgi:DNA polymerase-3 subunit delta'|nr:DNA polymerase III subunit delta' [Gammaproteobacteria bacterium]MBT3488113.1 DNA polymerase III subunit delta' [Gammaproteobacteria bacterium]MBT3717866.1 DNA polymerase III subunit delta' [Gammaproteobacteria bacterium]MBT3845370.1 DNA polymerase III subunit delta' [Gammaproteobacteria bacterium]MBT3894422.1 DNA polymerase III subunit delta' [Gammaproteobacteria bacterium]